MATDPISTFFSGISDFLKTHERLLIVVIAILASVYVVQKYFDFSSNIANKQEQSDQLKLQEQMAAQQAATLAAQQATSAAQNAQQAYQQLVQNMSAQNAAIISAISQRNAETITQQKTDATLPQPELADRMASLAKVDPNTITPGPTSMQLTYPSAVAVTQQLELVPTLQTNLASLQITDKNKDSELSSCNDTLAAVNIQALSLQHQVDTDKTVLAQQIKTDAAALDAEKKAARKSKIKIFFEGVLTGIGIRSFI